MIAIELIRNNPELVKENIRKKFQDQKLGLVDDARALDEQIRKLKSDCEMLRSARNAKSTQIGGLMREKKVEEANRSEEHTS